MTNRPAPLLFATDRTAAQLLDLKPAEFRALVEAGHLPQPRRIGEHERWDVQELQQIVSGGAVNGMGGVEW